MKKIYTCQGEVILKLFEAKVHSPSPIQNEFLHILWQQILR